MHAALPGAAADFTGLFRLLELPGGLEDPAAPDHGTRIHPPRLRELFLQKQEVADRHAEATAIAHFDAELSGGELAIFDRLAQAPVDALVEGERRLRIDSLVLDPRGRRPVIEAREHLGAAPAHQHGLAFEREDEGTRPALLPCRHLLA